MQRFGVLGNNVFGGLNMGRTDDILAGLNGQNEPAEFNGRKGYWIQAECVFIEAENPTWAINNYRDEMGRNKIACHHNYFCDSIQRSRYCKVLTLDQWNELRNMHK